MQQNVVNKITCTKLSLIKSHVPKYRQWKNMHENVINKITCTKMSLI